MKQKRVFAIVLFTSLSLAGLVVIQLLWMRNAIELSQVQFDHRVDISLNETLQEMERLLPEKGQCPGKLDDDSLDCSLFMRVDQQLFDSLLHKYIFYHHLDPDYEYRIIHTAKDSIVFQTQNSRKPYYRKIYRACLSCLYQKEIFHIELFFPKRGQMAFAETGFWLGASIFFLMILVAGFSLIIYYALRLRKMDEMKNDFINNMTHEFQTPISTISLAAEVLMKTSEENPSSGIIRKYAGIIFEENLRLRSNVQRVLQVAAAEQGVMRIEKSLFDIHQLIQDAIRNLCLDNCEKEVKVNYDLKASPSLLFADVVHIGNIISNLVENAIKYSGEKPEILVSTVNDQNGFIVSICDNGPGIPRSIQKKVFDKFYSRKKSGSGQQNGFGLGLFYVKTMIEAHGGRIILTSETGKGCRFDVFIPQTRNDSKTTQKE